MLFDFLFMKPSPVARYEKDSLRVDTCGVTDSAQSFETAVQHPEYNNGKWVVVEMYTSREAAQSGHDRWVQIVTTDQLPKELRDVSTAECAEWNTSQTQSEPGDQHDTSDRDTSDQCEISHQYQQSTLRTENDSHNVGNQTIHQIKWGTGDTYSHLPQS